MLDLSRSQVDSIFKIGSLKVVYETKWRRNKKVTTQFQNMQSNINFRHNYQMTNATARFEMCADILIIVSPVVLGRLLNLYFENGECWCSE